MFFFAQTIIKFTFEENLDFEINGQKKITIMELSSFLYDLNLLYDCIILSAVKDYDDYVFSQYFWYRKGRPLKPEHELYLNKINHNSPLVLEVILPITIGVASITWMVLQAFEKIKNSKLNHEKLKLEVEKLRLEVQEKNVSSFNTDVNLENLLLQRNALQTFNRILYRIEEHQLTTLNIEIINIDNNQNPK